jgi:hypothetical protein
MAAYLTVTTFKLHSEMPSAYVVELETAEPGFLDAQLARTSRDVDGRLAKRYAVPFVSPVPDVVLGWVARIVTARAWRKRGVDAQDEQFVQVQRDADAAWAEVREAADSNEGLFDLPLRADTSASGIVRGGPFGYSEQSPYVHTDRQVDVGRQEDQNRGGTGG